MKTSGCRRRAPARPRLARTAVRCSLLMVSTPSAERGGQAEAWEHCRVSRVSVKIAICSVIAGGPGRRAANSCGPGAISVAADCAAASTAACDWPMPARPCRVAQHALRRKSIAVASPSCAPDTGRGGVHALGKGSVVLVLLHERGDHVPEFGRVDPPGGSGRSWSAAADRCPPEMRPARSCGPGTYASVGRRSGGSPRCPASRSSPGRHSAASANSGRPKVRSGLRVEADRAASSGGCCLENPGSGCAR